MPTTPSRRWVAPRTALLVDHINHIEADLDLRPATGLGLRDAPASG